MSAIDSEAVRPQSGWEVRRSPVPVVPFVPAVLAVAFLVLPLIGLISRAPWVTLPQRLASPEVLSALRLSFSTATLATLVSLVLGVPLAWVLARTTFRRSPAGSGAGDRAYGPSPVVGGVALLLVFGRQGLVGGWLDSALGLTVPFTTSAVVMAQSVVAMPLLVIAVEGALRAADARYEEAAATLGADRWTVFRRVTLPLAAPGVVAGAVLCWARALGELGATITFAGNFPAVPRPCRWRSTWRWSMTSRRPW